jgi:hypothetical protein
LLYVQYQKFFFNDSEVIILLTEEVAKVFPQFQNVATNMEKSSHEYKIIYRKVD